MFTLDNLPNILKELDEFKKHLSEAKLPTLWQQLDQCQNAMQETHDSLTNPKKKQMLGELLAEVAKARKDCEGIVPDIEQEFKNQMKSLDKLKDLSAQLEQTEKALDDKLRADAELAASLEVPPPAVPEIPIDADHGAELAQELLQILGLLETVTPKKEPDDPGSVARMWSETESSEPKANESGAPPKTDRSTLKPRAPTPLRRPRPEGKPEKPGPTFDDSIGNVSFEDE